MDGTEREREEDKARYPSPSRAWGRSKSHDLIPKHTSLPNLHVLSRPIDPLKVPSSLKFQFRHLESVERLVQGAEHEPHSSSSSSPRVIHRRASAPASVILDVQLKLASLSIHDPAGCTSQKYPQRSQRVLRMGPHDPRPPSAERAFTSASASASTASSITYPMSSSSHPHPSYPTGRLSPQSQKQRVPSDLDLFLDSKKSRPLLPVPPPVPSDRPPYPPCVISGNSPPTHDMREALEEQTHAENNDGFPASGSSSKGNAIPDSKPELNSDARSRALPSAKAKRLRRGVEVRGVPTTTVSAQTPADATLRDTTTPANTDAHAHAPSPSSSTLPLPLPSEEPSAARSLQSLSSTSISHQPSPWPSSPSPSPSPSTSSSLLPMKPMKSFRTLRIKASRRMLTTDTENSSSKGDIPIVQNTTVLPAEDRVSGPSSSKPSSPSPSLRPLTPDVEIDPTASPAKQLRTLRRKKHFNILQSSASHGHGVPAVSDNSAADVQPIAITLNLRPSQRDLKSSTPSPPTSNATSNSNATPARPRSPLTLSRSRSRSRPSSLSLSRPSSLTFPKRKPSRPLSVVATAATVDESESASSTGTASPPLTPTVPTRAQMVVVAPVPTAPLVPPSTAPTGLVTLTSPPRPSSTSTTSYAHTETASGTVAPLPNLPSPTSSPVKLGHPSRPYYSAIRKGVMGVGASGNGSPPSSRPTSFSGPSPSPSPSFSVPTSSSALPISLSSSASATVRPKSYTPPSTTLLNHFSSVAAGTASPSVGGSASTSVASRHLSMSSLFIGTPPHTSPFSAFSVLDDDEEEEEEGGDGDSMSAVAVEIDDAEPPPPPPPRAHSPGLLSFSLSAASRRLSGGRGHGHGLGQGHGHRQTMSLSTSPSSSFAQAHTAPTASANLHLNANTTSTANASQASRHRNTIGFSMSGETELRMALAAAAAAASEGHGADATGSGSHRPSSGFAFKFRERASLPPPPSSFDSADSAFDSGVPPTDARAHARAHAHTYADANTDLGFWRMRTRSPPPPGPVPALGVPRLIPDSPSHSSNSFIGRVRKLRKGLKEMMLLG